MGNAITRLKQRLPHLVAGDNLKARLIRSGLGSACIKAVNRVLVLALGIVLARTLGAEGYGVYAYAFAIMALLMVVAEAGVPTLLMREVAANNVREDWGLLRGVLRRGRQMVGLASTSVAALGLLVLWAFGTEMQPVVFYTTGLMLLVLPLVALARTVAHAMRGLHRVVIGQTVEMLLRPLLVLLLVCAGFLMWPDLREPQYAMAAQLLAAFAVFLVGGFILRHLLPDQAKKSAPEYRSREWVRSALPFTLIGGAGIVNGQADMIMLGWFGTSEDVGIYRVAVQGAGLVAFGLQAVNPLIAPHFARLHARGDMARLQRLVTLSARVILLAALPIVLIFVFAGGAIVAWVFGQEFRPAHIPLAVLSVAQLVNVAYGSVGFLMTMTGHEKDAARTMWQTACFNIILNAALIPLFGMTGAAIASALSLVLWNTILYHKVRNRLHISSTAFRAVRT